MFIFGYIHALSLCVAQGKLDLTLYNLIKLTRGFDLRHLTMYVSIYSIVIKMARGSFLHVPFCTVLGWLEQMIIT